MIDTVRARFMAKVDVRGPDECWLWRAGVRQDGYGAFWLNGKTLPAHRVMYELETREYLMTNDVIMHTCDVRMCTNPAHLRKATQRDNMLDMIAKGRSKLRRSVPGSPHPNARLTMDTITAIRALHAAGHTTQRDLARMYGVAPAHIHRIVNRKAWAHI